MGTVTAPDGTTIAYDRSGEGPVLILVGAAFNDRQTTAPLAAVLAPHFTAVSYDRRGRGDSTDTAPYAVEREVEDLGSLIEALGGFRLRIRQFLRCRTGRAGGRRRPRHIRPGGFRAPVPHRRQPATAGRFYNGIVPPYCRRPPRRHR